jgi:hypothetical protein
MIWTHCYCCPLCVHLLQAIERSKGVVGAALPGSDDSDPSSLLGSELGENHGWEVSLRRWLCLTQFFCGQRVCQPACAVHKVIVL